MDETQESQVEKQEPELESYYIYFIKLMSGDAIIGKSLYDSDKMNEEKQVELREVMQIRKQYAQDPRTGNITEIQTIMPWLEGSHLLSVCYIPIAMVVTVVPLKDSLIEMYQRSVVQNVIKDLIADQEELIRKANEDHAMTEALAKKAKSENEYPEIDANKIAAVLQQATLEEKEPDRVTPESLHADAMMGTLDEVEDQLEKEEKASEPPPEPPKYVVNGRTLH